MSFLSSAFSGASNNFSPGGGSAQQAKQVQAANENFSNAEGGLNSLAQSLAAQAQGGGPNLANAQLQSATSQNVANQAALQAGQRGASANPALIARQAAMQGANIQQQAAGQSAQNVLAQQLAAQQQLGNVLGTQGSLANQNYGVTQGAITGNNQIGSQQAGQNAQMNQGLISGIAGAGAKLIGLADGGQVQSQQPSFISNFLGMNKPPQPNPETQAFNQAIVDQDRNKRLGIKPPNSYAQGGSVLPFGPMDLKQGGMVNARAPQEEATIQGNNPKNDKIPAMVSEGEAVIDRETMKDPGPMGKMARALAAHIEGKKKR